MSKEDSIKKYSRPECPACSSKGSKLYSGLTDHMFGIQGKWDIKKCDKIDCGTLWLDPSPVPEDLIKLYKNYSTHENVTTIEPKETLARNVLRRIRSSYFERKYGYKNPFNSFIDRYIFMVAYTHPAWKDTQEVNISYLPARQNGKLLDVGCGNGGLLQTMSKYRWDGTGIDFDEKAIMNARSKGLKTYSGDLFSQKFPDESFDAIVMSHVIEHVPSPIAVLKECHRILKKDGVMVIITPNSASRGHSRFSKNWRGLEVPTHLQIFSVKSLGLLAEKAGFLGVKNFSSLQGYSYITGTSLQMERNNNFDFIVKPGPLNKILKEINFFLIGWRHVLSPGRDEVAVVIASKYKLL